MRKEILAKIKALAKNLVNQIDLYKDMVLKLPVRRLSNIVWDEELDRLRLGDKEAKRSFLDIGEVRRFTLTLLIATLANDLLKNGKTASLREVYYNVLPLMRVEPLKGQHESDAAIEDLETILNAVREQMNIRASGRGYLVGPMKWIERYYVGGEVREVERDGTKQGMGGAGVPAIVEKDVFDIVEVKADFVLLIEKDATFVRLVEDEMWKKLNAILVTGMGQPPRAVRRLLHRLRYEWDLPVYVLTDCDPWGFYIFSVVKRGSINLAYLSEELAVPDAKFLGLTVEDKEDFNLPDEIVIKLKEIDKKRLKELMNYPWFKAKEWQKEFKLMLERNIKMEIQALASKGIEYISKKYLPEKIKAGVFLP